MAVVPNSTFVLQSFLVKQVTQGWKATCSHLSFYSATVYYGAQKSPD